MSENPRAILYVAPSLNGFMTRGETDSEWVSDEDLFAKISADIGCILVGRKTFEQFQGSIYPVPNTINIVLSKEDRSSDNKGVHFTKDIDQALNKIKELDIEKFIVVGGSQTISSCLEYSFIDQVYLSLHPYIFSNGLPAFGSLKKDYDLSFNRIIHQESNFLLIDYKIKETHA